MHPLKGAPAGDRLGRTIVGIGFIDNDRRGERRLVVETKIEPSGQGRIIEDQGERMSIGKEQLAAWLEHAGHRSRPGRYVVVPAERTPAGEHQVEAGAEQGRASMTEPSI